MPTSRDLGFAAVTRERFDCSPVDSCWAVVVAVAGRLRPGGSGVRRVKGELNICDGGYHLCRADIDASEFLIAWRTLVAGIRRGSDRPQLADC
jgi:hypothetical protein